MSKPILAQSFGLAPVPPLTDEQVMKCPLCSQAFHEPKVLACFHSYCKPCLKSQIVSGTPQKIVCPQCCVETPLSADLGLDGLLCDYGLESVLSRQRPPGGKMSVIGSPSSTRSSPALNKSLYDLSNNNDTISLCAGCKSGDAANTFCQDCGHLLCDSCIMAHQYMHSFEGHRVDELSCDSSPVLSQSDILSPCRCIQHRAEALRYFCLTCNLPICDKCAAEEHPSTTHRYERIDDVASEQMGIVHSLLRGAQMKHSRLMDMLKMIDVAQNAVNISLSRAHQNVDEVAQTLIRLVGETRVHGTKQLDSEYGTRQLQLTFINKKVQEVTGRLAQAVEFGERLVKYATPTGVLVFKRLLETSLRAFLAFNPDISTFLHAICSLDKPPVDVDFAHQQIMALMGLVAGLNESSPKTVPSLTVGSLPTPIGCPSTDANDLCPPYSQIRRRKMVYYYMFGEFGVKKGQFAEPSGVAVSAHNEIVIADANNHRLQVFDKNGRFKYQFGERGTRNGQLLYPNRVAVNRATGDFVITERSPAHQIQIYNRYGQFVRKFGADILERPRGVCVDSKGRIVVIECKVMRVVIFDVFGNLLQKFNCSRHLEFPNGVCTNDRQEIFISDNRAHCVKLCHYKKASFNKARVSSARSVLRLIQLRDFLDMGRTLLVAGFEVFNYDGRFVRQIGGSGITNYPIGVGINSTGCLLIADNHNSFNLTLFTQEGEMLSAWESRKKHAQCFDVALMGEGCVVLASKDYHIYFYRYSRE